MGEGEKCYSQGDTTDRAYLTVSEVRILSIILSSGTLFLGCLDIYILLFFILSHIFRFHL